MAGRCQFYSTQAPGQHPAVWDWTNNNNNNGTHAVCTVDRDPLGPFLFSSLPPVPAPAAQERAWAGLLLLGWCPPAPSGNCNVMMIACTVDVDFWCTFGLLQSVPRRLNCGQSLCRGEYDTVPYTESTVIRPADNRGDTSKQGACQQASKQARPRQLVSQVDGWATPVCVCILFVCMGRGCSHNSACVFNVYCIPIT
jgi:hypothetical protein